jgi:hypothetical protein
MEALEGAIVAGERKAVTSARFRSGEKKLRRVRRL